MNSFSGRLIDQIIYMLKIMLHHLRKYLRPRVGSVTRFRKRHVPKGTKNILDARNPSEAQKLG